MLWLRVASPTYVHRPYLSLPCWLIRPWIELDTICRHPPGLYLVGNWMLLVDASALELGICRLMTEKSSCLVLDWSVARLCSAIEMMSAWRVDMLCRTCWNCSYWLDALMPLILLKYSRVVFFGFGVVVVSPMKLLSVWREMNGLCSVFIVDVPVVLFEGGCWSSLRDESMELLLLFCVLAMLLSCVCGYGSVNCYYVAVPCLESF